MDFLQLFDFFAKDWCGQFPFYRRAQEAQSQSDRPLLLRFRVLHRNKESFLRSVSGRSRKGLFFDHHRLNGDLRKCTLQ